MCWTHGLLPDPNDQEPKQYTFRDCINYIVLNCWQPACGSDIQVCNHTKPQRKQHIQLICWTFTNPTHRACSSPCPCSLTSLWIWPLLWEQVSHSQRLRPHWTPAWFPWGTQGWPVGGCWRACTYIVPYPYFFKFAIKDVHTVASTCWVFVMNWPHNAWCESTNCSSKHPASSLRRTLTESTRVLA